ncbi:unnamed protein product [Psylliodes chrysocephalus]|uniref:Carboxylesterase type B domain-containing protein n=1 Tax=Psylliodes chrysocephalus TaxID=3402493 RepID=A0A9P0CXZ1_9CUCU|nr:unnamed protein product [Psylliodes chrysocephala]
MKSAYKEVRITDGTVLGKLIVTHKNTEFYAFQDIPYAQPPIGPLRLMEALPALPWEGVLNTTENSKICYQFNQKHFDSRENEDCLVLNVYSTADQSDDELLPVLFWIHGGGFSVSSGAIDLFGPHYFMDKKIVVVTVNFRLGPLGFLSTDDGVLPTNLGLRDQNLALKWVQKNIASFGGDPSKVTIGGQESGAALVGYHVFNKKSQGLFRAAILQSGSPLSCMALQKNSKNFAQSLAKALTPNNQSDLTSQEILHIIKTADIEQLKTETIKLQIARSFRPDFANCLPMASYPMSAVKEDENDENAFVTGMNHERLKNGDINRVPTLLGFNSEEVLVYNVSKLLVQTSLIDLNVSLAVVANLIMADENRKEAGKELTKLYTNSTLASTQLGSVGFMGDCAFTTPIARHALLQSQYTDVYLYQFSYLGILGRYEYTDIEGASYVGNKEELGYFWHNATADNLDQFPKEDILTHERVMEMWSQFIKHLNPTGNNSEVLGDFKWPKVAEEDFLYLDINSELTVKSGPKKYFDYSRVYSKYGSEKFDTY